jgi:hypothetical protein
VGPFLVFVALTALQGSFGENSRYWFYLIKTLAGAWLLYECLPYVGELQWKVSWEACVVGVLVCVMWIGLDGYYPVMGTVDVHWNPHDAFGAGSALAWSFILIRFAGSVLVVPPLEEVFYRSFVYRYIVNADFLHLLWRVLVPFGSFGGWYPRRDTVVAGISFVWSCLAICCPRCRTRVIWHSYSHRSAGDAQVRARYQVVCPACGFDPAPENERATPEAEGGS